MEIFHECEWGYATPEAGKSANPPHNRRINPPEERRIKKTAGKHT
jgi:hypothetical protein